MKILIKPSYGRLTRWRCKTLCGWDSCPHLPRWLLSSCPIPTLLFWTRWCSGVRKPAARSSSLSSQNSPYPFYILVIWFIASYKERPVISRSCKVLKYTKYWKSMEIMMQSLVLIGLMLQFKINIICWITFLNEGEAYYEYRTPTSSDPLKMIKLCIFLVKLGTILCFPRTNLSSLKKQLLLRSWHI